MAYEGEKKRAYQRQYLQRRRSEWIEAHGPCVDCGSGVDLEIDHDDRTQKVASVGSMWSRRREIREAELAKCVVRCRPCHLIKSNRERSEQGKPCPSSNAYRLGCRCDGCREVQKLRAREYRARRRNERVGFATLKLHDG